MIHKIARKHFIHGRFRKLKYIFDQLGGSSSLRVYLDTFILTYWTLLAFGWARWVNRVKVTRGCAMAWRPCRVSLYVLPPPIPSALPFVCSSACRFVCLTAHCALRRTLRAEFSFSSSVQFGFSVPSVCEKTSGCLVVFRLSARSTLVLQFGSVRFDSSLPRSVRLGRPLAYRTNSFVAGGKLCAPWKWVSLICVCVSPYVCVWVCVQ